MFVLMGSSLSPSGKTLDDRVGFVFPDVHLSERYGLPARNLFHTKIGKVEAYAVTHIQGNHLRFGPVAPPALLGQRRLRDTTSNAYRCILPILDKIVIQGDMTSEFALYLTG
jgi:hypothetical protein